MADLVTLTIDGKTVKAPAGTLVINAAKSAGIDIPAFCYYEGLALQAACRMCLVEVEGVPKLMASCTLPVREGMVVHTESPKVVASRKAMLEFLLTNHPLDCPVCDKGGECELQDAVFRYGAGEGRFTEIKHHVEEKQFSPVVFYDAPRCILCYRCVRICDEGLGVKALGVIQRGAVSEIAPNGGDHLECDECGACIDICPVGALTSGIYRYHTRPWEMKHVGTICTHCGDGCKTTLGVRENEIIRGNNRDRSGINGEFLCIKGRYAFDFLFHGDRLRKPLVKRDGRLVETTWKEALETVAQRFGELKERGATIGVIGSNRTTNEENYVLQRFAREALGTPHIDHHRTADIAGFLAAVGGRTELLGGTEDVYTAKALLIVGVDLAQQHPLLAFQARANWRHHGAKAFVVAPGPVREEQYAVRVVRAELGEELAAVESLGEELKKCGDLLVLFGGSVRGDALRRLVEFGDGLGIPVKYVCLADYANSRGAADMGLLPGFLPGYRPAPERGMSLAEMLEGGRLDALWVVGANPLRRRKLNANAFVVVQDLFLTETAQNADVVLPAASAYEKTGTVTNTCGEVQRLSRALTVMGAKPDLEIFALLAAEMGVDFGPLDAKSVWAEIRENVPGYQVAEPVLMTGGAAPTRPPKVEGVTEEDAALVEPAGDTLFTSGTVSRYSKILNVVREAPGGLFQEKRTKRT